MELSPLLLIGLIFTGGSFIIFLINYYANRRKSSTEQIDHGNQEQSNGGDQKRKSSIPTGGGGGKRKGRLNSQTIGGGGGGQQFEHAWLASTLKGHSKSILDLDFSTNGKYLLTCSDDRSLIIWNTNDFDQKEHKSIKGNTELDYAKCVRFAPDSKSILICLAFSNTLTVYKLVKKEGSAQMKIQPIDGVEFPAIHKQDIINIGISCSGKFVMSASGDTSLIVWDLKGNVLKSIDTRLGNNNFATISPCGRFVAASGFTPDTKVWEVEFNRNGEFQDVKRAFELKGHASGIHSFDFNQASTRMVTVSKDGTFRVWNTDIRYQQGQDAILIASGSLDELRQYRSIVAMSPSGDSLVIATNRTIRSYSSDDAREEGRIEDPHSSESSIAGLKFSVDGRYFVSIGDKAARVFHNVAGYRSQARKAKEQMRTAHGEALKERLGEQFREADQICRRLTGKSAL